MLQIKKVHGNSLKLDFYIHDDDSKAKNIIHKYEPETKENLDISHMIKNVLKKFSNETWKLRIKKTLFYAIKYCEDKLKQHLQRYLLHWKNDHSNCDKNCNKDLNKKNDTKI
jgi:uncharacterized membrane protein YheB (UPF0754 family)